MNQQTDTSWLDLDYKPKMPKDKSIGIAIIGAGSIVQACHLPVYQKYGLNVIGIYDVDTDIAEHIAKMFKLSHIFSSIDALLVYPVAKVYAIVDPSRVIMDTLDY